MSTHEQLHTYRCSFCKTTASSTLRMTDPPLKCVLCRRIMGFLYSTPISADEWKARNLNPPVFLSPHEIAQVRPEDREKRCHRLGCVQYRKPGEMLNGRFCSEECGALDSIHREEVLRRRAKLHQEMPWLRPDQTMKESA